MRTTPGLTRPKQVHPAPILTVALEGGRFRFTHTTIYGRTFTAEAPAGLTLDELAAVCSVRLALFTEEAFELAGRALALRDGGAAPGDGAA